MTTLKKSTVLLLTLPICIAIVWFSSFVPDVFEKTNMKFYSEYIDFDEYIKRLLKVDLILVLMNFIVLVYFYAFNEPNKNIFFKIFMYLIIVLQCLSNLNVLLNHYKFNISNPLETSVFYRLTHEFGWIAHLFYIFPLLTFILGVVFPLVYMRYFLPSKPIKR